jgi:drug/metabolite transporter (DMT)-like permease
MSNHFVKCLPAYAAIHLLWGGAYLAVHVLVRDFPPFLVAGLRYCLAAVCLIPIVLSQRGPAPHRRQVLNAAWTGVLMLAAGYGIVFWAEQRLSSWLASVLVSTSFLWTYLGECFVLRSFRFRPAMLAPLLVGLAGMPLLFEGGGDRGGVSFLAALAVLAGALCWAAGSLALKSIDLPPIPVQTAAIQLAAAGLLLLCLSSTLGEWANAPSPARFFAWQPFLAMAYLVLGGSVVASVAFLWLLEREPASLVATSMYVNPIVAMLLGILAAHERSTPMQLAGALAVLGSVLAVWCMQGSGSGWRAVALREISEP